MLSQGTGINFAARCCLRAQETLQEVTEPHQSTGNAVSRHRNTFCHTRLSQSTGNAARSDSTESEHRKHCIKTQEYILPCATVSEHRKCFNMYQNRLRAQEMLYQGTGIKFTTRYCLRAQETLQYVSEPHQSTGNAVSRHRNKFCRAILSQSTGNAARSDRTVSERRKCCLNAQE